jgi:uncharacterized protein (TIGR02453 family)
VTKTEPAVFSPAAFAFYEGLTADNSKAYWTAHKADYEQAVRAPMTALLESLAPDFGATPVLFRPYRDIRFSKDKSPYKTAQGGFLEVAPGFGYHLQVDAGGVRIGGGFHARDRAHTAHTARWRAAVDDQHTGTELATLVTALEKAGFEIGGDQVRTRPRGVDPDHPRLDLLRREFLTAARPLDPATPSLIRARYLQLRPLIEWISTNAPPKP